MSVRRTQRRKVTAKRTDRIEDGQIPIEGQRGVIRQAPGPIVTVDRRKYQMNGLHKQGMAWDLGTCEEVDLTIEDR